MTDKPDGEVKFDWRSFTPEDSPKTPVDLVRDPAVRDLSTPKLSADDPAFGFKLPLFDFSDGTEKATGESFDLLRTALERPVALIFGSYT